MGGENRRDSYHGEGDLLTGGGTYGGMADLNRTTTGWDGHFEFDSSRTAEVWIENLLATYGIEYRDDSRFEEILSEPWQAELQVERRKPRPTTVTGNGQRVSVKGDGTPPWEAEKE